MSLSAFALSLAILDVLMAALPAAGFADNVRGAFYLHGLHVVYPNDPETLPMISQTLYYCASSTQGEELAIVIEMGARCSIKEP